MAEKDNFFEKFLPFSTLKLMESEGRRRYVT